ncbi:hypothetical protein F7725_020144 [Dissostichus mawsoni]|uniref:Uncharacterized protein n=1 Tax=Dissostichus mawsoni TaxID=36200 RepID=A0A7J5YCC9_DISMA|nr:hypothetical protein F7725_020144 [Dissostichus mawsoni]
MEVCCEPYPKQTQWLWRAICFMCTSRLEWKGSTKIAVEVEKLLCNTRLCNYIKRQSPGHQTSMVEGFHSLVNHFTPKMFAFSYSGMMCRTILAALHFNENSQRAQQATRAGNQMYSLHYPKYKQGGHIVRKVLDNATFGK